MNAFDLDGVRLLHCDALSGLQSMEGESVHCCVTSPPYFGLRDYGHAGQIGMESTPDEFVQKLVDVFREVKRVLRDDGTLWLNIGDSYAGGVCGARDKGRWPKQSRNDHMVLHAKKNTGLKNKDLIGIPWMVAFALRADGWYLRQDIIWSKPNPMPESVTDRCTKAHEYIFLLSKSHRYYYDHEAIKEAPAQSSIARWNQNIEAQAGSDRVPGKTNGAMKAVGGRNAGNKSHKYVDEYNTSESQEHRTKAGLMDIADVEWQSRNKRSVWTVGTKPFKGAHFATFNPELIMPCIMAGSPAGGTVLDPFMGSGTTAITAHALGRRSIGCEINGEYLNDICIPRVKQATKQQRLIA